MDRPDFAALTRLLDARYSCRAFRPEPVPDDVIAEIVQAAGRAPSWCNAQPWQVTVTRGAETARFREALLAAVPSEKPAPDLPWPEDYPGIYGARRRECGFQLYDAVGIERSDRASRQAQMLRNFAFFDAPHVAIVHSEAALGPYGAMDCGGFVAAFLLAAQAKGVATIAQASVASYPGLIRAHFGLDESRLILCAISFGHEDAGHPANAFRTSRAELDDILDLRG
ncbi:MAG: nitroreductase [Roseovarius sp.]